MPRRRLEVADVVRAHRDAFIARRGGRISSSERQVLDDIATCRTAARGGHVERCTDCGHERIAYNSCRNRHCPKCQESARAGWLVEREQELLPVEYFHVVFTIPHALLPLTRQNRILIYNLLFRASADALRTLAADPRHLGGEIGFLAVLHTWGQALDLHPHVHCVVPGGAIAPDGSRWIACKPGFFLPVRALGRLFRGKFLHALRQAYSSGRLTLLGPLAPLQDPVLFQELLRDLFSAEWVVYAKPPFGGPAVVLRYLARYSHRVAISNTRLLAMKDGRVTFLCKDYRRGGRRRTVTFDAVHFLQRFLQHRLPKGFVRIRHFGFLGNRHRKAMVARCRAFLSEQARHTADAAAACPPAPEVKHRCPECRRGTLRCVLLLPPGDPRLLPAPPRALDSS